jgi:hypothetical protein
MELQTPAGRIDVAWFARPYRRDQTTRTNAADCVLIVECKDFKSGLDYAHSQGKIYAKEFPSAKAGGCHERVLL